jgi:hypothetical protein
MTSVAVGKRADGLKDFIIQSVYAFLELDFQAFAFDQ